MWHFGRYGTSVIPSLAFSSRGVHRPFIFLASSFSCLLLLFPPLYIFSNLGLESLLLKYYFLESKRLYFRKFLERNNDCPPFPKLPFAHQSSKLTYSQNSSLPAYPIHYFTGLIGLHRHRTRVFLYRCLFVLPS